MLKNYNVNERHIVLITDDNYVMPTRVVITSLISNIPQNNEYDYFVHICTFKISENNKSLLENCSSDNVSVDVMIISENQYAEKFARINQKSHVTPAALIKFDLCKLFPNVNELLYIDSDIIINKPLDSLFSYDITDKYLAASFEFWQYMMEVYKYKKQNVGKPDFYFNSGILLFNLKKMRDDNVPEKLWETKFNCFNNPNAKRQCMDQDSLNAVLAKNCLHLPIKYNLNCAFTEGYDINQINFIFDTNYKNSEELKEDGVIIHYVGKTDKPWKYSDAKCRDLWDFYYEKAGFNFSDLNRIKLDRNLKYYFDCLKFSLNERGLISTIKYILHK